MDKQQTVKEWQEHIESMVNALLDFRQAIGIVENDYQFMSAYQELVAMAGDVLDQVRLRSGSIDDLRACYSSKLDLIVPSNK